MRILILSLVLVGLSSCTMKPETKDTVVTPPTTPVVISAETPTVQTGTIEPTQLVEKVVGSGSLTSLNYILRDGSPDGKILETTIESVAKSNNLYLSGMEYKPYQVVIGSRTTIVGFEKGLLGMKKGEKKLIQVSPEEGYGTTPQPQEIAKSKIAPVMTMTQPMSAFADTITETVNKSELNEELKQSQVGKTITGQDGSVAKVVAVTENDITFEIENKSNPFYKKQIAPGMVAEDDSVAFKIVSIENDQVNLEITNKMSPFLNKKFAVGESVSFPQGGKITITGITDEVVSFNEEHPMMGKTLYFDVEILDIQ
ncbi:FKBP-type peptidyl-prolyl cis-trans isomerase [Candidatus Gracilibacteria bacterium]|nr:FKBP-type peptidyl-prolyl cis-trans isomerase [Candidatus Gracilibacteria bacterium]